MRCKICVTVSWSQRESRATFTDHNGGKIDENSRTFLDLHH
jgi:hypothetical protein